MGLKEFLLAFNFDQADTGSDSSRYMGGEASQQAAN